MIALLSLLGLLVPTALLADDTPEGLPAGHWIDVRTPEEYAEGHVAGAKNIPHDTIAERIAEVTTDKNATIHVYCKSGRRAEKARETLLELGYKNVTNHGGYEDVKDR